MEELILRNGYTIDSDNLFPSFHTVYYIQKKNGYCVFEVTKEGELDYSVYNLNRDIITRVWGINFETSLDFLERFISLNSADD